MGGGWEKKLDATSSFCRKATETKGGVSLSLHPSAYCRGGECKLYARPPMGTGQGGAHPGGEVTRALTRGGNHEPEQARAHDFYLTIGGYFVLGTRTLSSGYSAELSSFRR